MQLSPIQTPDGRPIFSMGGPNAWKTAEHRGYCVSLEWVGGDRRNPSRVMCIWPATNVFVPGEGNGAWCIGQRAITDFVQFDKNGKCTGSVSHYAVWEALKAMPIMGKDPNDRQALYALLDVLVKFAPELVLMPPAPRHVKRALEAPALWDVTRMDKASGKVLDEREI